MPNWCEGQLKIRGKIADLKNFVLNALEPVDCTGANTGEILITGEDDNFFETSYIEHSVWLKDTRRHFCDIDSIDVYADDPETPTILVVPMRAAWCIDADGLLVLCQKYNVDMKIQGFEQGGMFSQIIEIVDGEIIQDETIEYDDWDWDCPCPLLGG